ncbi:MerR family transcriptional regulator [Litchfieldia salsa]|uniref:Mercuric resistance operon regulatory protein n=1 Tax=Litchfieldia salsa TaxID=930152 RepID=A0A1H0WSJ7_9BACI|nr:MerR family transcriptional regulator [Litchfieldia salsa]SDP93704.1 MerR family transcriptional regulator, mercuric resistance operon regulatory protein [Litchfieldia salsa]
MEGLTISKVAKQSNINLETVRYYEKRGLIPEPPRSESGYRIYSTDIVDRIKFIKRAQELGFTLNEIEELLLISEGGHNALTVKNFTTEKIKEVNEKINDLIQIKNTLEDLLRDCPADGTPTSKCPIIQALKKEGEEINE